MIRSSLIKIASAFLLLVLVMGGASTHANAAPISDPSGWTAGGAGPGSITVTSPASGVISMDYHKGTYFCSGCGFNQWDFTVSAPETGLLSFDFTYNLFSAWFQAQTGLEVFVNNALAATLFPFQSNSGGSSGSGSLALTLVAGDIIDFRVTESNNDLAYDIGGNITLSNFGGATGEPVPAPGALAVLGFGLLGIGGLRRKAKRAA